MLQISCKSVQILRNTGTLPCQIGVGINLGHKPGLMRPKLIRFGLSSPQYNIPEKFITFLLKTNKNTGTLVLILNWGWNQFRTQTPRKIHNFVKSVYQISYPM